jgi:mannose-6-phosphate isomerase-like protein (cupin superfamily)
MNPMIDVDALTQSVYGGDVVRSLLYTTTDNPGTHVIRVAMASAEPGRGGQLHHHPKTDETYFIISGTAELEFDGEKYPLSPSSCVRIPRGTRHRITNTGTETRRYLAFHTGDAGFEGAVEHVKAA